MSLSSFLPSFLPACLPACALVLAGCSTITQGVTQNITINTNPVGASCYLERLGNRIETIDSTPATVTVTKTRDDIRIVCNKPGYQTATYWNQSGWESGTGAVGIAVDVLLTAGLSSAIDSATGADNKYESPVNITLISE
ncbi:MAG: PEGA domain-containing protein [Rhodospirillales bacterium]|nr:PEGA domain-containing protein [Rhodospirillales bacterium]